MEAEYVALSMCMRELIPLRSVLKEIQGVLGFKCSVSSAACTLFEDNQGAVTLANVPRMTPRSKHIAIPYHFFREHIKKKEVEVNGKVDMSPVIGSVYAMSGVTEGTFSNCI